MKKSSFEGVGGLKIATRSWEASGPTRAIMILVHGFNAHSGYMEWPGEQFSAHGLATYALDLRGRGESEGERFYVENWSDYLTDLDTHIGIARAEHPELPIYILGHSAGGVLSTSYVHEHQTEIAGLICESFAYDVGLPHLVQLALEGVGAIAPHVHVFSLKNSDFSRDPAHVEQMNNDPLIAKEAQPAETAAVLLKAAYALTDQFPEIKIPVLIIHGTEDHAAKFAGSQKFYDTVGSTDKTLKLYEGHYHDLLGDVDKEIVMADIQNWLDERIPAGSSAVSA